MKIDVEKAVQAFGVLLRREGKSAGKLRLLKLLYMADRKSIEKTGYPILGSRYVAMKHGPLHSEVFDLIGGRHIQEPFWSEHFRTSGRTIILEKEPETGKLSGHEIQILTDVVDQHLEVGDWEVVNYTHTFQEWLANYPDPNESTSFEIPLESILEAVGRSEDKDSIRDDLNDDAAFTKLFSEISS